MPQVPTSFVPQVGVTGEGANVQFVAPGVAPMENLAAQQQVQLGRATESLGNTVWRAGQIIEDDINTAKAKGAEGAALDAINEILTGKNGYMYSQGQDADTRFSQTEAAIAERVQGAMQGLDNDVQKAMFQQSVSRAMNNARNRMFGHRNEEIKRWQVKESSDRSERFVGQAIDAYKTRNDTSVDRNGNPVGEYDTNVRVAIDEARKVGRAMGYQDGSEAMMGLERNRMDSIATGVVGRLMQDSDYSGGLRYLEGLKGQVNPDTYEKLLGALTANRKRQTVDELADNIVAGNGLLSVAATTPLVNVIDQPDSIVSMDEAKGFASWQGKGGVFIVANPGTMVRAPYDGVVVGVQGKDGERGTRVTIRLENGDLVTLGNMDPVQVGNKNAPSGVALYEGKVVGRGDPIGVVDSDPIGLSFQRDGKDIAVNELNMLKPGEAPPRKPSTLQEALAEANGIDDTDVRKDVRTRIRQRFAEMDEAQQLDYAARLENATGKVSRGEPLTREEYASLSAKDRDALMTPFAEFDNRDMVELTVRAPGILTYEWLAENKGQFTRSTYNSLYDKAGAAQNALARTDAQELNVALINNGYEKLVEPKTADQKQQSLLFRQHVEQALQKARRDGTLNEKTRKEIINDAFMNMGVIMRKGWFGGESFKETPLSMMTDEQKQKITHVNVESVKVPRDEYEQIVKFLVDEAAALKAAGIPDTGNRYAVTESNIMYFYRELQKQRSASSPAARSLPSGSADSQYMYR